MKKYFALIALGALLFTACGNSKQESPKLKAGKWVAEFSVQGNNIPFVFEVDNTTSDTTTVITLINGAERVPIDDVTYSRDTVTIYIKAYDTQLQGVLKGDTLTGLFKRLFSDSDAGIPFKAVSSNAPRFVSDGTATDSIAGKWDIQFITDNGTKNNVGIFAEKDGIVTGSILTNSGDFRYLEGVSDKDGFRVSAFAGLSAYLIKGKFTDKDHFEGEFVNARGTQKIVGTRNDKASLEDPYSLTTLKKGYKTLDFKFPNLKGDLVSLSDPKFKDKVVVISILGSWCPNCLDEMAFLAPWYDANKDRGVEIVGLAFERKDDPEYVNKVLTNLAKKHNAAYEILFAGKLGDEEKALPAINGLKTYPTSIFIDKKGEVRKIHTGFSGPATGLFYEEFKRDFNNQIDELLKE